MLILVHRFRSMTTTEASVLSALAPINFITIEGKILTHGVKSGVTAQSQSEWLGRDYIWRFH